MAALAALVFACTSEPEVVKLPVEPPRVKKNPFSVEVFNEAYANIVNLTSGRTNSDPPPATHKYIRFEPQTVDQIIHLQYLGYELWDEPLDEEIDYEGDYYHHPGLPDSLNYFYTLVPVNYQITPDVPYTIISNIVLFDEYAGDEQDPEDPWIPDPECPDPYNPNCPCYEGPCARQVISYTPEKREDLVKKTTKYLRDAGVNLIQLYNEMMRLAGYPEDILETDASGRTMGYRPSGCIRVQDNSAGASVTVPVKLALVKLKRWFKLDRVYTNAAGCFTADKEFRKKAKVFVKFKNNQAKVRGINGALKIWQYTFPVKRKIGMFEGSSLTNIQHTIFYNSNPNNMGAMHFAAAHCLNSLYDFQQYCNTSTTNYLLGYAPGMEYSLNIWISSVHTEGASAPMLRSILNTSLLVNAIQFLFPGVPSTVIGILKKYAPDITMRIQEPGTSNTRSSASINGTFFHEFAHATHYNHVGNNYWVSLISAIVSNNGYGTKSSPNSGIIAVAESWGFFIGPTFTRNRYSSNSSISNLQLDFLEKQRNENSVPVSMYNSTSGFSSGWIPWGMHHDLMDVGEPSITLITDQVSGYTINGIFKGFHSGSTTVQQLKAAILANNNNSQAAQVNTLVADYGW